MGSWQQMNNPASTALTTPALTSLITHAYTTSHVAPDGLGRFRGPSAGARHQPRRRQRDARYARHDDGRRWRRYRVARRRRNPRRDEPGDARHVAAHDDD